MKHVLIQETHTCVLSQILSVDSPDESPDKDKKCKFINEVYDCVTCTLGQNGP